MPPLPGADPKPDSQSSDGIPTPGDFELVQVASGAWSVRSCRDQETFHPVVGPVAEAQALYVRQLDVVARARETDGEFVIWDVGLGAAANVLTVLRALAGTPTRVRIESFDHTLAPLAFARTEHVRLGYFDGFEGIVDGLLADRVVAWRQGSTEVSWRVHSGDFPKWLGSGIRGEGGIPHAVMWDAYSPARNPAMWTLPVFGQLRGLLPEGHRCALATYSRSTLLRVTLLLAGFWVGAGSATGEKEETTVAGTEPGLVPGLLPTAWLERARRSTSAEPLREAVYRQNPPGPGTMAALARHPQFRTGMNGDLSDKIFAGSGTDMA